MQLAANHISVKVDGNASSECLPGTPVRELLKYIPEKQHIHILGALVNNDVVSLSYPLEVDSQVRFLTLADSNGWRIYRRSAAFLLSKVAGELFPDAHLNVEHSLGDAFYCNFERDGKIGITDKELSAIESRMRELVEQRIAFERRKIFFTDAIRYFEEQGMADKCNLLRFDNPPKVVIHWCDGWFDLAHGPLVDDTGYLTAFRLLPYPPGFVLQFPDRHVPPTLSEFERQPHLFQIFKDYKRWGRTIGVRTVGDLNALIARGELGAFVQTTEAFQEKQITRLADTITERRGHVRWVLIAGPSSSGKTTFTKRLAIQLKVNGLRPVAISVDDYFVDRTRTPRDEEGNPDFEHIETIDLELLHEHLATLDKGGEVKLPSFNFHEGTREYRGKTLRLDEDQIGIIEGIHSLNPRMSSPLPAEHKFKIYISALTQLNLDFANRLSTTDNRLIRRMVRDNQFRGNSALMTLQMWPSVRRGEKKWIFPFQQEADAAINSALDYELAVLKSYVEPMLTQVKPSDAQYADARRLQEFLGSFISAPTGCVPPSSILREFIGESSFNY